MDLIETKVNVNRHPWELSRTEILIKEINKYHRNGNLLDIGCGDLYFDKILVKNNKNINELYGIDINLERDIKEDNCKWFNDKKKLKKQKFSTIVLMDVLEHVKNDNKFLKKDVIPYLKDDGYIILTVPAFQLLYGKHDEELLHYRRYKFKDIKKLCQKNNLIIEKSYYFYLSLFLVRLFTKNKSCVVNNWNHSEDSFKTKTVKNILNMDAFMCKLFKRFGLGLSLCVIAKKKYKHHFYFLECTRNVKFTFNIQQ